MGLQSWRLHFIFMPLLPGRCQMLRNTAVTRAVSSPHHGISIVLGASVGVSHTRHHERSYTPLLIRLNAIISLAR